jgi:hypothetical protein
LPAAEEEGGFAAVLRAAQPLLFVALATALRKPLPAPLPRSATAEAAAASAAAAAFAADATAAAAAASTADTAGGGGSDGPPPVLTVRGAAGPHSSYNDEWLLDTSHTPPGSLDGSRDGHGGGHGGGTVRPRYRRKGNRKDVLEWDGARWTLNGSKYRGGHAAFWHPGVVSATSARGEPSDGPGPPAAEATEVTAAAAAAAEETAAAPWPPLSGWTAHPDWRGDLVVEGGFDMDAAAEAASAAVAAAAKTTANADAESASVGGGGGVGSDGVGCDVAAVVSPLAVACPRHPQVRTAKRPLGRPAVVCVSGSDF